MFRNFKKEHFGQRTTDNGQRTFVLTVRRASLWSVVRGPWSVVRRSPTTPGKLGHPPSFGFTLLEVMVAITILAGMSLAMFGATSQILNSKDLVEERDERSHSVSFALNKMADDINAAYFVKSKDLLGSKFDGEINFEGKEDRLDFVSFNHLRYIRDAKETDSAEISYYLVSSEDDPDSRILMRRESPDVDKDLQAGGKAYPLLEGVRSIRFEYLPDGSDEYKSVWDTGSVDSGNKMPRAVKISLEVLMPDEETPRSFTTLAPIRMSKALEF